MDELWMLPENGLIFRGGNLRKRPAARSGPVIPVEAAVLHGFGDVLGGVTNLG